MITYKTDDVPYIWRIVSEIENTEKRRLEGGQTLAGEGFARLARAVLSCAGSKSGD